MAKDRIDRSELADKLMQAAVGETTPSEPGDPLRRMAEMLVDFAMEAEVSAKLGAEPHERSDERVAHESGVTL